MGKLTTHILDTMNGTPAEGVRITLHRLDGEERIKLSEHVTNADGRTDTPLLDGNLQSAQYELVFLIGDYFRAKTTLAEPPFLDVIPIRFGVSDAEAHYHVPLLASPFSYSTYRGS